MTLIIEVTAEDIKNGVPEKACSCPIALAIDRAIPGARAEVFGMEAFICGVPVCLPVICKLFVELFDSGGPVYPFTFSLDLDNHPEGWSRS